MNEMEDFKKLLDKYYHKELTIEIIMNELNITKEKALEIVSDYMDEKRQQEWEDYNKSLI